MSPPLYLIAPLFAFSLTISFLSLTICQLPRLEWTTTGGTSQVWTWIRNLFLITIEQISKGEYYCHRTIQTFRICCLMKEQWVTTVNSWDRQEWTNCAGRHMDEEEYPPTCWPYNNTNIEYIIYMDNQQVFNIWCIWKTIVREDIWTYGRGRVSPTCWPYNTNIEYMIYMDNQ